MIEARTVVSDWVQELSICAIRDGAPYYEGLKASDAHNSSMHYEESILRVCRLSRCNTQIEFYSWLDACTILVYHGNKYLDEGVEKGEIPFNSH